MSYVSVIIPVFNGSGYVRECITMLQEQSLRDIEMLFVDDCSTDDSADLIQRYAKDDPRIRLIRHDSNKGPGAARNTGISSAIGRYFTFLDIDDRYESYRYLESLFFAAEDSESKVSAACFCNVRDFGKVEDHFDQEDSFWGYSFSEDGVVQYDDYQFDYGFHRFMFSRQLFRGEENRFPDLRFYEDPVFLTRILFRAGEFFACADQRYLYRCEYRREHWTSEKVLDFLDGVTRNLTFSRIHEYAYLHWATLNHLECETSRIGIGFNHDLDLAKIDEALCELENSIDVSLLAAARDGGKTKGNHTADLLIRRELDQAIKENGKTPFARSLRHRLSSSALWYHVRPFVK